MASLRRFVKERVSDCYRAYRAIAPVDLFTEKFRILMYHAVQQSDPSVDTMGLAVSPQVFSAHMGYLKDNGFDVIGLMDLVRMVQDRVSIPDKSIVITFDDGYRSVLENALPVLHRYHFTATVFVTISCIENKLPHGSYWRDWPALTWDEVSVLRREGIAIGSHAVTHTMLTRLSPDEAMREIKDSKEIIQNNLKEEVRSLSYPHGAFNKMVIDAVKKAGYRCACSSVHGTNGKDSDVFRLRRTEITAFDTARNKFEAKLSGSHDWLGLVGR